VSKDKNQILRKKAKKAEKAKRTRKDRLANFRQNQMAKIARSSKVFKAASLLRDGETVPDITDDEYVFWLCHGANFIVSDETQGTWEPLFDGIYEGTLPEPEQVAQSVISRYEDQIASEDPLAGVARAVLAWTVTEKSNIRIYKYEAERRLREKNPELDHTQIGEQARQPYNPVVWGLMAEVKTRTLEAG